MAYPQVTWEIWVPRKADLLDTIVCLPGGPDNGASVPTIVAQLLVVLSIDQSKGGHDGVPVAVGLQFYWVLGLCMFTSVLTRAVEVILEQGTWKFGQILHPVGKLSV